MEEILVVAKQPWEGGDIQPPLELWSRGRGQCKLEARENNESMNVKVTTTSRGECAGLSESVS